MAWPVPIRPLCDRRQPQVESELGSMKHHISETDLAPPTLIRVYPRSYFPTCLTHRKQASNLLKKTFASLRLWVPCTRIVQNSVDAPTHLKRCFLSTCAKHLSQSDMRVDIGNVDAIVRIERWRVNYSTIRPHCALGYQPPATETVQPHKPASAALQQACVAGEGSMISPT